MTTELQITGIKEALKINEIKMSGLDAVKAERLTKGEDMWSWNVGMQQLMTQRDELLAKLNELL